MTAVLVTPPATEPVLLSEAKAHLRVETAADDDLIGALIAAARVHLEAAIRRVLIDQTWRIYCDDWPASGILRLPVAPVRSVTSVVLYGQTGVPSPLAPSAYTLDTASAPARLRLADPAVLMPRASMNGIEITVVAGYGPSGLHVPQPLRTAIMLLVTRWYDNRDGLGPALVAPAPDTFERLIAPYRILRVA